MSPCTSSDLPESSVGHTCGFLFGLAPGGVYPATDVTTGAVCSYHTISPLPVQAVYFLWHFPSARAAQILSGTLPCGARTFLCRSSDYPADSCIQVKGKTGKVTSIIYSLLRNANARLYNSFFLPPLISAAMALASLTDTEWFRSIPRILSASL